MTRFCSRRRALAAGVALSLFTALAPLTVSAHETVKGDITVDHAWARINIAGRPSAAYATIKNAAAADDRILSAASPAFARIELHTHAMTDGVMRMRRVEAIEVPAGGAAELVPGGLHIMLFEPTRPIAVGDLLELTLTFANAGEVTVTVIAEELSSSGPTGDHDGHGGHGDHSGHGSSN